MLQNALLRNCVCQTQGDRQGAAATRFSHRRIAAQDDEPDLSTQNVAIQLVFKIGFNVGSPRERCVEAAGFAIAPAGAGVGLQQGLQPIHFVLVANERFRWRPLWHHHRLRQQVHQRQYAAVDSKRPLLQPQTQSAAQSPAPEKRRRLGTPRAPRHPSSSRVSLARLPSYINGSFSKST